MTDSNALEGTRVILSLVLFFTSFFGLVNTSLGILIIPRVVRGRILFRRRVQMLFTVLIAIILGLQSAHVTFIPNADEPSLNFYTANYSVISVLSILIVKTLIHLAGWWREGSVLRVPLDPEAEEKAEEAIKRGRQLAHLSNNTLQLLGITLEEVITDQNITPLQRKNARLALENIITVKGQIEAIHSEIKLLHPSVFKELPDDTKYKN